jgi:hypothetical protein
MRKDLISFVSGIVLALFVGGLLGASLLANIAGSSPHPALQCDSAKASDSSEWLGFLGAIIGAAATITAGSIAWFVAQPQIKAITSEHLGRQVRLLRDLDNFVNLIMSVALYNKEQANRDASTFGESKTYRMFPVSCPLPHADDWRLRDQVLRDVIKAFDLGYSFGAEHFPTPRPDRAAVKAASNIIDACEQVRRVVRHDLQELGVDLSIATHGQRFAETAHLRAARED